MNLLMSVFCLSKVLWKMFKTKSLERKDYWFFTQSDFCVVISYLDLVFWVITASKTGILLSVRIFQAWTLHNSLLSWETEKVTFQMGPHVRGRSVQGCAWVSGKGRVTQKSSKKIRKDNILVSEWQYLHSCFLNNDNNRDSAVLF